MRLAPLLLISTAALSLAACTTSDPKAGSSAPDTPPASSPASETSVPTAPESAVETDDPVPTPTVTPGPIKLGVRHVTVKGVGADIVTINGWTAYRFEVDTPKPSKVNCGFDCLIAWPPALTDGTKVEVSGIDASLVGTVGRTDRPDYQQVTLGGWPLYKFKDDKVPTDVKGENVGCNWSLVKPDGKPVFPKKGKPCVLGN